jgi:hypothetical protein
MAAEDVILLLLPVQLHEDREHKQVFFWPSSSTMAAQDVIRILLPVQLHDDREHKQVFFWPSSSTMAAQDVIRILLPVQFHDREHKQVVLVPTPPTRPRTLLPKQLYYDSTRCDSPSASCSIA